MAKLSVRTLYGVGVHQHGRKSAAKYMARMFAERLRSGIDKDDAEDLAQRLDRVADGVSLTVAMGFAADGRPSEFDRDWRIFEEVEALRAKPLPLVTCYRRAAEAHRLSVSSVKRIYLEMRAAHWYAHHPDED